MPKISEAAGPTDESQPGYYDEGRSYQSPNVVAADDTGEGDDVSPGNSSSTSGEPTVKNEKTEPSNPPSTAPNTGGRWKKASTGPSGVSSVGTTSAGKGRK